MTIFDTYMHGYDLCNDTVTVYHYDSGSVSSAVYDKAYFDFKKTQNTDRTGSTEANGFLLVIPGDVQACRVGDKVLLGRGEDAPTDNVDSWWRSFIPAKVENLVVVKYADTKRFGGVIVHTEAGG